MPLRPVFVLTFANQQDAYLQKLKTESRLLNDALYRLHDQQSIEVFREESATATTIADALNRFGERIAIFHYAGHAAGDRLYLEDGSGAASGVSILLGQLKGLQLVFLNGCSTLPQVKRLFDAGVRAVIATAVPIDDERAVQFAERFYLALSNRHNLGSAFQSAVGFMKLKYGGAFNATMVRRGELAQFDDVQAMPWGLFLNNTPEAENVLNWEIPLPPTQQVQRPADIDYQVNTFMIDILAGMIDHDPKLEEAAYVDGELKDEREILALIIENFPWPIGVQIRLLATKDENLDTPSPERIRQIASTYVVTFQFLFYILYSQLWDEQREGQLVLDRSALDALYLTAADFNYFNYHDQFLRMVDILAKAQKPLFVKELTDFAQELQDPKSELYIANDFLQKLRGHINAQDNTALETNRFQWSADGEYALSVFLGKLAFLVNYDLITIRDIHVVNYRHLETKFNHFIGRLNAKVNDLTVGRTPKPRPFPSYANTASVVLTPNTNDPKTFLNLSPFIVDKNAFGVGMTEEKATEQQLYMYAFREGAEYKYFTTIHNIYRVQERPTDQFLTSEGAPKPEGEEDPRTSRLRNRLNRTKPTAGGTEEEAPSPYAILKMQFQVLETDLTRN